MSFNHKSITRTVQGETDKRIIVSHPLPLARAISYGNNWTRIRIGIRLSFRRSTNWVSPPLMYFGLSSGSDALPGTATPNHFIGLSNVESNTITMASGNPYLTLTGTNKQYFNRIANGSVTRFPQTNNNYFSMYHVLNGRSGIIIEIQKGEASWTLQGWTSRTDVWNVTPEIFKDGMGRTSLPTGIDSSSPWSNMSASGNTKTFSIDEETNGYLDTVCFSWLGYGEDNAFEISDIDYAVLA